MAASSLAAAVGLLVASAAASGVGPIDELRSGDELAVAAYLLDAKPTLDLHVLRAPGSASGLYLAKALLFLATIMAVTYVYGKNHKTVEAITGMRLTHFCCIAYAGLSISIDLSIKNAAEAYGGHFPFNPACGVIVVEYCKLVVSAVLFGFHYLEARQTGETIAWPSMKDVGWLGVPAFIYAVNNLVVFQAIRSTPLATFGVVRETMLIWNALIWTATFRHPLATTRWLAILGIFLGCTLNQLPKMLGDEFSVGVFWSALLAFSNAAGAVANEYAFKQRAQVDINLQNAILYTLCGSFVLIGLAVFDPAVVASPSSFFKGFVPECLQVIILQIFTGLAVSRILKYVEAVTKTVVAAIRGPGVIIFGSFIFGTRLSGSDLLATVIVSASCYLFLSQGPLLQPAAPKDGHPCETDKLLQSKLPSKEKV